MYSSPKYLPFGDCGLLVEFGDTIDPETNRRVLSLDSTLRANCPEGVKESVPTYRSLLIEYDPEKTTYVKLCSRVRNLEEKPSAAGIESSPHRIVIPAAYGGEFGPDLEDLARLNNMTTEEVVRLHSEKEYRVYMVGFVAGFPYLGEVDERIATPRLSTPRLRVPAGSVGIAGKQTGIYPCEAPGGWRIIARTPLRLFDYRKSLPGIIKPGDIVKFRQISGQEYDSLEKKGCKEET